MLTTNQNYASATLTAVVACLQSALTCLRCVGYTGEDNSDCREHFRGIEAAASTFGALADKGLSTLVNKEEDDTPNTVKMGAMISEFVVRSGEDDLRSFPSLEGAKEYSNKANAKTGKCRTYVVERWPDRRITQPETSLEKKTAPQVTQVVTQPVVVPMSATVQTTPAVQVPISEVRRPRPVNPNVTKQGNTSAPLATPPVSAPKQPKQPKQDKGAKKEEAPAPAPVVKVPTSYPELVASGADNIRALAKLHGINPADYTGKGSGFKLCKTVWDKMKGAAVTESAPEKDEGQGIAVKDKETMMDHPVAVKCVCGNNYPAKGETLCKACKRLEASKKSQTPVSSPTPVVVTKAANDKGNGTDADYPIVYTQTAGASYKQSWCGRCKKMVPMSGRTVCRNCADVLEGKGEAVAYPAAAPTPAPVVPASKPASKAPAAPIIVVGVHAECGSTLGYKQGMSEVPCPKCKCMIPTVDLDSEDMEEEAIAPPASAPKTTKGAKKDKGEGEGATLGGKGRELLAFLADNDGWVTQREMSAAGHNNLGRLLVDHKTEALVSLGFVEEGQQENDKGRKVKAYMITEEGIAFLES